MINFICKMDNGQYILTDKEIKNVKPTIDKHGNALLIVNYYDFEFCCNVVLYCNKIEAVDDGNL